ncbi:hypothetical protein ACHMW4_31235 [Mesorhizobium sp. UC22_110]|uniref:hypothetical protein n=1 Tax=Mesorhizobium sp. UC22_110 TaxID=3374552 RepID=UPI0037579B92
MPRALTSAKVATGRKSARRTPKRAAVFDRLELETVPEDQLAAVNAFYKHRRAIDVTLAGQPAKIATAWPVAPADGQSSCKLGLKIGDHFAELVIPLALAELLLATVDKTARLENLLPRHAALLLETAAADELDALEGQAAGDNRIRDSRKAKVVARNPTLRLHSVHWRPADEVHTAFG